MVRGKRHRTLSLRLDFRQLIINYYPILILLLIGIILRFYRLGTKSLWFDEVVTFDDLGWHFDIWKKSHSLYFLPLKAIVSLLGHSDFTLRLLSAIYGVLGIIAIYLAGREIFNKAVANVVAFIITFATIHIYFSQEARYYTGIFFYSALSLYFMGLFFNRKSAIFLIGILLADLLNYFTHPTAITFGGVQLGWLALWLVVSREGRGRLISSYQFLAPRSTLRRKKPLWTSYLRLVLAAFLLGAIAVGAYLLVRIIFHYLPGIKGWGRTAPGIEFSLKFFVDNFNYYTLQWSIGSSWQQVMFGFTILLALVGYTITIIRQPRYGLFFVLLIITTFTLLFTVPLGQVYAIKYIFFVFPINILCLGCGLVELARVIDHWLRKFWPWPYKAALIAACFLTVFWIKEAQRTIHYYQGEKMNVKEAIIHYQNQVQPEFKLLSYGLTNYVVRYYRDFYNIDKRYFRLFAKERGDGTTIIANIIKYADKGVIPWVIFAWHQGLPPRLKPWVKDRFELVKFYPSIHGNNVYLYRWKYHDSFISDERESIISLGPSEPWNSGTPGSNLPLEEEVFIERTLKYNITIDAEHQGSEPITADVNLDKQTLASLTFAPGETTVVSKSFAATLPADRHMLTVNISNEADLTRPTAQLKLLQAKFRPLNEGTIHIEAEAYELVHSTYYKRCQTEQKRAYFMMERNAFAGYFFACPNDGWFRMKLMAKHDKPGPIILETLIDDRPVAVFAFNNADNSWEEKGCPLNLEQGTHRLEVYYVSDVLTDGDDPDLSNDAFIDYIEFQPVTARQEALPDQRLPIGRYLFRSPVGENLAFYDHERPGSLAKLWEMIPPHPFTFETIDAQQGTKAIKLQFGRESDGANVVSPVFRDMPDQIIYFSAKIKTQQLINHSANVLVDYLDHEENFLASHPVNAEGISGDTAWTRLSYIYPIPDNVGAFLIRLAVYPNSSRPSKDIGTVWFSDFRFEHIE